LKKSCIIIGAGLSGLTAAHELIKNNWEVTTLDKGRGVGGRMATRRTGEARFDHGAQYFSTKTADFQAFTQNIIQKNIAKKWNLQEGDKTFSHARVIGIDGMNMIPKFLAEGLNIKINEKVISISETKNGCKVITEAGNFYESDALICTTPAPQAIEILNKSNLALADIEAWKIRDPLCFDSALVNELRPELDAEILAAVAFAEAGQLPGAADLLADVV
jgi:predicted NAD/FAD-dependent oxidoreductase